MMYHCSGLQRQHFEAHLIHLKYKNMKILLVASYLETESHLLSYLYLKIYITFQMLLFLQHELLTA